MATFALLALEQPAAEAARSKRVANDRQAELGQFMTPDAVADFMAHQFDLSDASDVKLLDAGAGQGALSTAFARHWTKVAKSEARLTMTSFELDTQMIEVLRANLSHWRHDKRITADIVPGDFIVNAVERIQRGEQVYTHAILNPPYKKIGSNSPARLKLASVGIETVNLYSGFVALSLDLLRPGGELIAIIPRSFCNGPYYKSFRQLLLSRAAIKSIHLFTARDKTFSGDNVLQENVIIRLRKAASQGDVLISASTDATFADLVRKDVPFSQIVIPADREQFIHIPVAHNGDALARHNTYRSTLSDSHLSVSTGPIVDFRLKRHLRAMPGDGDVPLLYPGHFADGNLQWPRVGFKKANAIALNAETQRWLYPRGFYVVVRRFSSKEEKRRIVAYLIDPNGLPSSPIGFENHLNVFHHNKGTLSEDLARGLTLYLNARIVDDWFRQFNGHTQVNATDLRSLPYPNTARLIELGRWSKVNPDADETEVDRKVERLD